MYAIGDIKRSACACNIIRWRGIKHDLLFVRSINSEHANTYNLDTELLWRVVFSPIFGSRYCSTWTTTTDWLSVCWTNGICRLTKSKTLKRVLSGEKTKPTHITMNLALHIHLLCDSMGLICLHKQYKLLIDLADCIKTVYYSLNITCIRRGKKGKQLEILTPHSSISFIYFQWIGRIIFEITQPTEMLPDCMVPYEMNRLKLEQMWLNLL